MYCMHRSVRRHRSTSVRDVRCLDARVRYGMAKCASRNSRPMRWLVRAELLRAGAGWFASTVYLWASEGRWAERNVAEPGPGAFEGPAAAREPGWVRPRREGVPVRMLLLLTTRVANVCFRGACVPITAAAY